MKYTIHGFSQSESLKFKKNVECKTSSGETKLKEIKIDCTDLMILRWFVDFYPNMSKVDVDGVQYAWVRYDSILEDLPLLDIKKQALFNRLNKLCEFGILRHRTIKVNGTFSYYGFGEKYKCLVSTEYSQINKGMYLTNEGVSSQISKGTDSNNEGVVSQISKGMYLTNEQNNPSTKDLSTKNLSTKDKLKEDIKAIVDYLNEKAGTKYRATTDDTVKKIKKLMSGDNPYTVEDFKTVIDKKCKEWKGTEFEKYLRPSTLFGNKFENYLNQKDYSTNRNQQYQYTAPIQQDTYNNENQKYIDAVEENQRFLKEMAEKEMRLNND